MQLINDLKVHNGRIRPELDEAISRVMDRGWFALGPEVNAFEAEFADYCGTRHCIGVGNGTDALEISLRGMGVSIGDEVVLAANAGMYATIAVLNIGATPIFADINERGFLISADSVRECITAKSRAIVVTHLFGALVEMDQFVALARDYNLRLLEDCAQAHGAQRNGRLAGSWGDAAAFSFYPTKNLGALGDGGGIVTYDDNLAAAFNELRQYGWSGKYEVTRECGRNSRLDELQAAVLRAKLPHLSQWNEQRRAIAQLYCENLEHPLIEKPDIGSKGESVHHLYVIKTEQRESLKKHLDKHDIATDVHYPILDKDQPILSSEYSTVILPNSEKNVSRILTLPCYPELDLGQVTESINAINSWKP